jgi:ribosomal protein S18 acetylase RimI-like enzyme
MMGEDYDEVAYPFDIDITRRCFRQLIDEPSLGLAWILLHNSHVAGYIVLTYCFCLEYGGREGYVDDLFVRKPFRRMGLGRLAIDTVIAESLRAHLRMLNLEVEPRNEAAQRLYSATGFEHNRRLLMRRRIEPA